MNFKQLQHRISLLIAAASLLIAMSVRMHADTGTCNGDSTTLPFTDVPSSNTFFCSIAEAYFSGLTNGTSSTTYNPSDPVPREQMAAFITRTMDQSLRRGSRRGALNQWWTPTEAGLIRAVTLSATASPFGIVCDGQDLWISDANGHVYRVQASDGKLLGTWTGATGARGLIAAGGAIFIAGTTGGATPGKIYLINPDDAPGAVTTLENDVGFNPYAITCDGANLWTANLSGSISRFNLQSGIDSTFTAGFTSPIGILWDGSNLWVADTQLKRVNPATGIVLETIASNPISGMQFDGFNIWLSSYTGNSVTVVRAQGPLRGTVLATLSGNGIHNPYGLAFDGERILVCNNRGNGSADSVSVFKATDFSPLANVSVGANSNVQSACSDGVNFWVLRPDRHDMVRY